MVGSWWQMMDEMIVLMQTLFPAARGARDEQVGHLQQIEGNGLAGGGQA